MSGTPGFIYVLSNPSMPGIVKIGRSTRHPELRALELYNTSSGVPTPFVLEFAIYCKEDHEATEEDCHEELSYCRVNGSREFFRICVELAVEAVSNRVMSGFCLITCTESYWIDPSIIDGAAHHLDAHPMYIKSAIEGATLDEIKALLSRYIDKIKRRHTP